MSTSVDSAERVSRICNTDDLGPSGSQENSGNITEPDPVDDIDNNKRKNSTAFHNATDAFLAERERVLKLYPENARRVYDDGYTTIARVFDGDAAIVDACRNKNGSLMLPSETITSQSYCCSLRCTYFLSRAHIVYARSILPLSRKHRQMFHYAQMKAAFDSIQGSFTYRVEGRIVCEGVFCSVFGIGKHALKRMIYEIENNVRFKYHKKASRRTKRFIARFAKLVCFLDTHCQLLPDCNGCIVPPGMSRTKILNHLAETERKELSRRRENPADALNCKCACHSITDNTNELSCRCQLNVRCRCDPNPSKECRCRVPPRMNFNHYKKMLAPTVRFRNENDFTKCNTCVTLKRLREIEKDPEKLETIEWHLTNHYENVHADRMHTEITRVTSITEPHRLLSLSYDGMSKKSTKLPHLLHSRQKAVEDTDLAFCSADVILIDRPSPRGREFQFDCYLNLASAFKGGANATISTFVETLSNCETVPPTLILNMDNCNSNKNYVVIGAMAYLLLQLRGKVSEIILCFAEVGHTHGPCDALFGRARKVLMNLECRTPESMKAVFEELMGHRQTSFALNFYDFQQFLGDRVNNFQSIQKSRYIRISLTTEGIPMVQCGAYVRAQRWLKFKLSRNEDVAVPVFKEGEVPGINEYPEPLVADVAFKKKLLNAGRKAANLLTTEEKEDYFEKVRLLQNHIPDPFPTVVDRLKSRCNENIVVRNRTVIELRDPNNELLNKFLSEQEPLIQRSWMTAETVVNAKDGTQEAETRMQRLRDTIAEYTKLMPKATSDVETPNSSTTQVRDDAAIEPSEMQSSASSKKQTTTKKRGSTKRPPVVNANEGPPVKRGRGRPPKQGNEGSKSNEVPTVKRGRGRPPKHANSGSKSTLPTKKQNPTPSVQASAMATRSRRLRPPK